MQCCQSCGKILKKNNTAVNVDGTETHYCTWCYSNGGFNMNLSCSEMQKVVWESLKAKPIPKKIKEYIVNSIPKLERWRHENTND